MRVAAGLTQRKKQVISPQGNQKRLPRKGPWTECFHGQVLIRWVGKRLSYQDVRGSINYFLRVLFRETIGLSVRRPVLQT